MNVYIFTIKKNNMQYVPTYFADGRVLWKCPTKNRQVPYCPATVTQDGDVYMRGGRPHCHEVNRGAEVAAAIKRFARVRDLVEFNHRRTRGQGGGAVSSSSPPAWTRELYIYQGKR